MAVLYNNIVHRNCHIADYFFPLQICHFHSRKACFSCLKADYLAESPSSGNGGNVWRFQANTIGQCVVGPGVAPFRDMSALPCYERLKNQPILPTEAQVLHDAQQKGTTYEDFLVDWFNGDGHVEGECPFYSTRTVDEVAAQKLDLAMHDQDGKWIRPLTFFWKCEGYSHRFEDNGVSCQETCDCLQGESEILKPSDHQQYAL